MDSVHGTKTVRLQRKKGGLGFSVKGGQEHGVPIVVSWIKPNGAAGRSVVCHTNNFLLSLSDTHTHTHSGSPAKQLRLGDIILAVNGRSLQTASHSEAVERLKHSGPTVLLRVKPNQVLAGKDRTRTPYRSCIQFQSSFFHCQNFELHFRAQSSANLFHGRFDTKVVNLEFMFFSIHFLCRCVLSERSGGWGRGRESRRFL